MVFGQLWLKLTHGKFQITQTLIFTFAGFVNLSLDTHRPSKPSIDDDDRPPSRINESISKSNDNDHDDTLWNLLKLPNNPTMTTFRYFCCLMLLLESCYISGVQGFVVTSPASPSSLSSSLISTYNNNSKKKRNTLFDDGSRSSLVPWRENLPARFRTHRKRRLATTATDSKSYSSDGDDETNIQLLKRKLTREFFSIGAPAFIQVRSSKCHALQFCKCKEWNCRSTTGWGFEQRDFSTHSFQLTILFFLQLAAEPLAALVDTAYLGKWWLLDTKWQVKCIITAALCHQPSSKTLQQKGH